MFGFKTTLYDRPGAPKKTTLPLPGTVLLRHLRHYESYIFYAISAYFASVKGLV